MPNRTLVAAATEQLIGAYDAGVPTAPLTDRWPQLTVDDAYDIQLAQVERWRAAGRALKGHKVGLTSPAMQAMLGVDQPDFGHLLDDMFWAEHDPIPPGRFLQPRIEPEIAFVLRRPLGGPGVTVADALGAVDFVLPALEIIDSRVRDWKITIVDTIADNASSGGVVLGSRPARPGDVDLRLVGCNLTRNGGIEQTGAGGACLGTPVAALVWLANTLGAYGVGLEAGQVVLPGSCTAAVPVEPGDVVSATFAGLGAVTAAFGKGQ